VTTWTTIGGRPTRLQCPHCDWHVDEPPTETAMDFSPGSDTAVWRMRQESAVPAMAVHVVRAHPESDEGRRTLDWVRRGEPVREEVVMPSSVDGLMAGVTRAVAREIDREAFRRVRWVVNQSREP
jgi:hypothetical protein